MLKRFEVQNFKNFKDKFVFDLSETKNYEFNPECVQNGLVSKAIIYGVNGCGKSNLGLAIFDFVAHLTDKDTAPKLYKNFLHAESKEHTAQFKYCFQFDDSILEYHYGKVSFGVLSWESLSINGEEVVFYQHGEPFRTSLKGTETLDTNLGDPKLSALKYIRRNANLIDDKVNGALKAFFKFVDGMLFFSSLFDNNYIGYQTGSDNISQDILKRGHLKEFEDFLIEAGVNCQLESIIEPNGQEDIAFMFGEKSLNFFDAASTGTQSLALFYYWLQRLKEEDQVSFVFVDEFDAFYHHKLSQLIVSELKKVPAQVILTTHNTSIMTNDLLRPDCYFVMHENQIDPIYQFTDKELRFAHNIENMFRRGAFNG